LDSKKKILRYITGIDEGKSTPHYIIPKWKSEKVESANVKTYHNAFGKLSKVTPSARTLLDVILLEMDYHNYIKNDTLFKEICNSSLKKVKAETLAFSTINNGFKELHDCGILIKGKTYGRGVYRVNLLYFAKMSEKKRIEILRKIKEAPYKDENNMLRADLIRQQNRKKK